MVGRVLRGEAGAGCAERRLLRRELLEDQLVDETLVREGGHGHVGGCRTSGLVVPVDVEDVDRCLCVLRCEVLEDELVDETGLAEALELEVLLRLGERRLLVGGERVERVGGLLDDLFGRSLGGGLGDGGGVGGGRFLCLAASREEQRAGENESGEGGRDLVEVPGERRVGGECSSACRCRWSLFNALI